MKSTKRPYDITLVNSLYRSGNDILIRLAKRNVANNQVEFDKYIETLIQTKGLNANNDLFSELCNIDWIFLNSVFIALFSNFENLISKLAQVVASDCDSNITINDIKGKGYIDQYRKYMFLVGKIKSAETNSLWSELDIYKLVRNKLAHEDGHLIRNLSTKLESRKEFKYLIENKVILAGPLGHIRIRETYFLERFCNLTNGLLDNLLQDIETKNP